MKRWKTSKEQKFHHSVYVILLDDASTPRLRRFPQHALHFWSSVDHAFDGKI
jgi:hypothetical protein